MRDFAKNMTIKNLNRLIYAVNFDDIDKFHLFMRDFKSHGETFDKYANFLCERMALEADFLDSFDFYVFVPSSDSGRVNYSLNLAELISSNTGKPLKRDVLKKIKHTKELKTLPREERHKEIEDSFSAKLAGGERICIIDDVSASGATLEEISKALKNAGAAFICASVVAVYIPQSRRSL